MWLKVVRVRILQSLSVDMQKKFRSPAFPHAKHVLMSFEKKFLSAVLENLKHTYGLPMSVGNENIQHKVATMIII